MGGFASSVAPHTPFLLLLIPYASFVALEQTASNLAADADYQKALDAFNAQPGLSYERMESSLLRAFDGYPAIVPPPNDGKRPARLFEVRMYESNTLGTLRKKVKMFNDGDIGAFQRAGGVSARVPHGSNTSLHGAFPYSGRVGAGLCRQSRARMGYYRLLSVARMAPVQRSVARR